MGWPSPARSPPRENNVDNDTVMDGKGISVRRGSFRKWLLWPSVSAVLVFLLWWAFRKAPLAEIWIAIRQLRWWQIAIILTLNGIFYKVATLRWWTIISADNKHIPYLPLLAVRISVFGVSYFTLGPQVGGEPLQVFALQKRYGLTYTHATATVLMDKLLEFLVDFLLLAIGLTAILRVGVLSESRLQFSGDLLLLAFLIFWPPVHLILLYNRHYPVSGLMRRLPFIKKDSKPIRFLRAAERLAARFCQRHPRRLLIAIGYSLLAGAGMLLDYALMTAFLNIHLSFWKMTAGWMMGWISLIMPLPGGLGALEASQVFTLGSFGFTAATALGLTLVMRGRDILIGSLGLLLAGTGWNRKSKHPFANRSK
jgi:glycosyltransferase 2 family protein